MATFIRIMKNIGLGVFFALLPLFQSGLSNGFKGMEFAGGAVIIIIGLTKDTILKEWIVTNKWAGIVKDFITAMLLAAQPIIQSGLDTGMTWVCIIGAIGISAFTILANVIKTDVQSTTAWGNVLKDTITGGLIMAQPIVQLGIETGQGWKFIVAGVGMVFFTCLSNEIKEEFGIGKIK